MLRRILILLVVLVCAGAVIRWFQVRPHESLMTVYFVGTADNSGTLVPVERVVRGRGVEMRLRGAVEALLAGPTAAERAAGVTTEIPAGVRLLGLSVRDGTAIIDLTDTVASGGGSSSMQGRVWQVVYTGTQLGVRQVRILINGDERPALGGEGVLIDRPIGRPPAFPRF
jgi:spore germination protein GerM